MRLGVSLDERLEGVLASPSLMKKAVGRAAKAGAEAYTEAVHDWIAAGKAFRSRTGNLASSIAWRPISEGSSEVFTGADYGTYVEKGTRAHVILPRNRKVLRWPASDGFAFAKRVYHPGTRPRPFFFINMSKRRLLVQRAMMEVIADVLELD